MSWYTLPSTVPWLTLVIVLPLAGALLVALTPGVARSVIKQLGVLSAARQVAYVEKLAPAIPRTIFSPARDIEVAPNAAAGAGVRYHDRILAAG